MSQNEVASGVPVIGWSDIGTTLVMLVIVLGLILALAWMAKKFRLGVPRGYGNMQVLSQLSLGQKERIIAVRVGQDNLLLGVTAQQVHLIKALPDDFHQENGA
ncbi:MAG: flagellar biosynthetic protein FliO [Idiomarinaceae bacterium HL-53]|nr:MAG: flagellar biosynthetic protein FliO [Idiomarinaceae bacterium HL-53]CUS48409.1 flagellar protein FliO/FliZ [Idiomarinaceae bacterium HL-53]